MKTRRNIGIVLMIMMLTVVTDHSMADSGSFPVSPATLTENCLSQDDAIAVAKNTIIQRQGLTHDDLHGSKIKANFVRLENGEAAWMVMIDSDYGTDALVTLSPTDETIIDYQATDDESPEITMILLKQWRARKGDMRSWSVQDKALFDWLFGSADEYIIPDEGDISQEKAASIALEAVPQTVSTPSFSCSFELLPFADAGTSQRAWRVAIYEKGKERYVVYLAAEDGSVIEVINVSNLG